MPECKHINLVVKESAKPIVHDLAKQKVLSLSKEIIPAAVKEPINDFIKLQSSGDRDKVFSSVSGLQSEFVSEDYAESIPLGIVAERKASSGKRMCSATEDAIAKMTKKHERKRLAKNRSKYWW